jgi:hypothetical protein
MVWLNLGLPADMTSFLWLMGSYDKPMTLALQYYGTNSILVMQASKDHQKIQRLTN